MDARLVDEDESVQIAVRALGDMRNSRLQQQQDREAMAMDPGYLERVSSLPLVNTAMRAYAQGKASSRVVKYGAEIMESGVKTTINYLQPSQQSRERESTQQTDEDTSQQQPQQTNRQEGSEENSLSAPRSRWQTMLLEAGGFSAALSDENLKRLRYCLHWLQYATHHIDSQIVVLRDFTDSLQGQFATPAPDSSSTITPDQQATLAHIRQDIVQTIRQAVDVVSKYAGGSSLPEPARIRIKSFILTLPRRLADRAAGVSTSNGVPPSVPEETSVSAAASGRAGSDRRAHHRQKSRSERGMGSNAASPATSRASSPAPRNSRSRATSSASTTEEPNVTAPTAMRASQRVLALATESLDMMRGVTSVVKDSLERADAWVDRLKYVGMRRESEEETPTEDSVRQQQQQQQQHHDQPTSSSSSSSSTHYPSSASFYTYRDREWDERSVTSTTTSTTASQSHRASDAAMDYFSSQSSMYSSRSSLPGTPLGSKMDSMVVSPPPRERVTPVMDDG